jgi:hypothetical protein
LQDYVSPHRWFSVAAISLVQIVARQRLCETGKIHKREAAAWRFFNGVRQKSFRYAASLSQALGPACPLAFLGEKARQNSSLISDNYMRH